MRILIMETSGISPKTMNLHVRVSRLLKEDWQRRGATVDLITIIGSDEGKDGFLRALSQDPYDILLMHYSSWYVHVNRFEALMERNKEARRAWITSDYEISPYHTFLPLDLCISNFVESVYKDKKTFYADYRLVNLNCLSYQKQRGEVMKKYDCIYYGRYREDRILYFKKYLSHPDVWLSTSSKNMGLYKAAGARCRVVDKMSWTPHRETLSLFRSSLYIEDVFTHDHYNHLGTRFYEGVLCNTPLYFDRSCLGTISKSGYEIDPWWIVSSPDEWIEKTKNQDPAYVRQCLARWDEQIREEKQREMDRLWEAIQSLGPTESRLPSQLLSKAP